MSQAGVALLASRFLGARRRGGRGRLIGAIVGVALSMVPLVVVQQVAEGMIGGIAERFIETGSYHLQAVARDAPDPEAAASVAARVERLSGVTGASVERRGFGLLYSDGGRRSGVSIRGVSTEWWREDPRVRELMDVSAGEFDLTEAEQIVVGAEIAARLEIGPGDSVRMLTVRPVGEGRVLPRVSRFTVAGVVSSGYRDLDRLWAFVPLSRAQRIIPDETATDLVGIKVDHPRALPNPLFNRGLTGLGRREQSRDMLNTAEQVVSTFDAGWLVYDWYSAERGRYVSFLTSRNLLAVVMAMIVLVAVVNISSALVLLVVEKEQDIAILRATGVSSRDVALTFVVAGFFIGVAGATLGAVVGLLAAININEILRGIETVLSVFAGQSVDVFNPEFYLATIPVDLQFLPAAGAVFLVLALSVAAAIIPARRAARIPPDRILRHGGGSPRALGRRRRA
ncbi:MAG: FtsX-like permease family protein [Alkalispirochaeta sp.]